MAALITNKGKEIICKRLRGEGVEPKYIGWGSDDGTMLALDVTNTGLGNALPEARVAGVSSIITTTTANDTYQVVGTITASDLCVVREIGLFDAATGGNLFMRATFGALNLEAGDSIQFTITCQFREIT